LIILRLIVICFTLACFLKSSAQQYSYRHYDIKDGLVGNHVYHAAQDKDGFLWFATETGVSRFDGTHFRNFTTADGLPDNEVIRLHADGKGRVWMSPFKNTVCYYYKGKIHNSTNDSIVKSFKLREPIRLITQDDRGAVMVCEERCISIVTPEDKVVRIDNFEGNYIRVSSIGSMPGNKMGIFATLESGPMAGHSGVFYVSDDYAKLNIYSLQGVTRLIESTDAKFTYITPEYVVFPEKTYQGKRQLKLQVWAFANTFRDTIVTPLSLNWASFEKDQIYFCTQFGVKQYNLKNRAFTNTYLTDENVSFAMNDNEGSTWFTTLGKGVYRLISPDIKKIIFPGSKQSHAITALAVADNSIIAGNSISLYRFNLYTGKIESTHKLDNIESGTLIKIKKQKKEIYFLTGKSFYKTNNQIENIRKISLSEYGSMSLKDFGIDDNGNYTFATHSKVVRFRLGKDKFDPEPDLFNERSTAICYEGSRMYIGTLYGLHCIDENNKVTYLGSKNPLLANRVTLLLYAANHLWVGTNDYGLICYKDSNRIKSISVKQGLTGNIIRALYADGDYLWVGTDRGLNKINIRDTSFPIVQRYTSADGLTSDMINSICAVNNMVYVGTPDGLSFFDETKVSGTSNCQLRLLGITVSGVEKINDPAPLFLRHKDNNIRFDFVGISYKSAGDIVYSYRLSGIDDEWKTTKDNFLQYPTLPSGSYILQLQATNKFGEKSEIIITRFEIAQAIAEKTWFRILVLAAALSLTWWIASLRTKRIRRREQEKAATLQRIAELEQQALRAQMNPHFIFNCLNSIQQYVFDKDVAGANRFITGFSRLIRQTMENSSKHLVSIAEEEAYLNSYLTLEKNRFEDKFEFTIAIDEKIMKDEVFLPPMLLQPFIENSIRHGIRLKQSGKGLIEINISLGVNHLICTIIDNGAGRVAAEALKSSQHIEYQSRGMQLTSQRINLLNTNTKQAIELKVEDLEDNGIPSGTKVTISLPLQNTVRK
jgi:Histidine kinase/Y_Y_Y domain/Two component regulator propeller